MDLPVLLAIIFATAAIAIPCLRYVPTCVRACQASLQQRRARKVAAQRKERESRVTAPRHLGKRAWDLTSGDMAKSDFMATHATKPKRRRRHHASPSPIGTPFSNREFDRSGTQPRRGEGDNGPNSGPIVRTERLKIKDGASLSPFGTRRPERAMRAGGWLRARGHNDRVTEF